MDPAQGPLQYALRYLRAGLSVIPIRPDGTKQPTIAYSPYKGASGRLASEDQAREWWGGKRPPGIAVLCGLVSGGLELIDFDVEAPATFAAWREMLSEAFDSDVFERLSVIKTPRDPCGYHVAYRCPGVAIPGNVPDLASLSAAEQAAEKELAKIEGRPAHLCLIETRGEGGYFVTVGSPDYVHETGRPYVHFSGPTLDQVGEITPDERDTLLSCCRALDRLEVEPEPIPRSMPGNDLRPGDDFDRRGWTWDEILTPHGWVKRRSEGGVEYWSRQGKKQGWSATTGKCTRDGIPLLRVFSSNAEPFEAGRTYGPFRAFSLLNHDGNLSEAARTLRGQGFGSRANAPTPPPVQPQEQPAAPLEKEPTPVIINLQDVQAVPVCWLWREGDFEGKRQGWLPLGGLAILDGDPGLGKSSLTLDLAARLSRGHLCGEFDGRPAASVLLGAEDSLAHTVRPRLDAMGADCRLIHAFDAMRTGEEADAIRPVILPKDLERLARFILENGVRLVVVDPLMAYLASDTDAHKDQDVRRCLRPLARLAEKLEITILLVRHLNKLSGGPALYRGGSSIGITGASRASLIVGRDPREDRHVLAMNKVNVGPRPSSLAYRLVGSGLACKIEWLGQVELIADQILGHGPSGGLDGIQRGSGRPALAIERAKAFLTVLLADGRVLTSEVMRLAAEAQIKPSTLSRARAELGIIPERDGDDYYMKLPDNPDQDGSD